MSNLNKYLDIYKREVKIPSSGKGVQIRPLTTNDIKKLLVYEGNTDPLIGEDVIDSIIIQSAEGLTIDDVNKLYLQDRYFLIFEVRKFTKGSKHSFHYQCQKCKNQSPQQIDLEAIQSVPFNPERNTKVKILDDKVTLVIDHVRREEQKAGFSELKLSGLSETQSTVEIVLNSLAQGIKEIHTPEGVEDITFSEKIQFIENLPSPEYDKINGWFEENQFGLDFKHEIKCPHCGEKSETGINLNSFFD